MRRFWIAVALLLAGAMAQIAVTPQIVTPVTTGAPGAVATGSALTGSSGTSQFSSAGRNWALSQSPRFDFDPLGRVDFPAVPLGAGQFVWCFFVTDIQVSCFGRAAPVTSGAIERYFSPDGGQNFRATSQTTGIWNAANNELNGVTPLTAGGYVFVSGRNACTAADGPFYTTPDGVAVTVRPCTGTFASTVNHVTPQNVNTFLAPAGNAGANDFYCRSGDAAASWQCQILPAITGFTGTNFRWTGSGSQNMAQVLAIVAPNIWLGIGNDTGTGQLRIIRSTDDGLTWTQVLASANANVFSAIQCLSSTICLAVNNNQIYRSVDGGITWTTTTPGPSGTNTRWQGIAVFDNLTASVLPWGAGNGSGRADVAYTNDGGATWNFSLYTGGVNGTCPNNTGAESGLHQIQTRNGRGLIISNYSTLTSPFSPCVHYTAFGSGGVALTGPLGVPLQININGEAPVVQGDGWVNSNRVPWVFAPAQRPTIFNSSTTGAANTAVVTTIAAAVATRVHVYAIEAFCAAAGTAQMTIQDGATTIYLSPAAGIPTAPATLRREWNPPLTSSVVNTAMTLTAAACGAGNTTTLHVSADQY